MNSTHNILILFLATVVACSCAKTESGSQTVRPVSVRTITLDVNKESGTRTYIGEVEAAMAMPLYHSLGGELTALHVRNGQQVTKGQSIADIDDTQMRSIHDAALATLSQAEDAYNRLLQVHESGGLSEVQWIEMQTNLEKAKQQEISTRKSLDDCHLTSPIDGVVTDVDVHVGQRLLPSQTVCTVLSLKALQIVFSVPESDITSFSQGDTIIMTLNAFPDRTFCGIVLEKGLSAGMVAHAYEVKAKILSPSKEILPGMLAKVVTTKSFVGGLVVPSACVQMTPTGPAVWVVRDGVARRQQIGETSFVRDGVLVNEGLNKGDQVVVAGYQKLYNGAQVVEAE
ncbi:MAG: efflux RND transporter periplasmic adaptor subunit [Bacteroidales bacterium]|nr:efflux RND transporter periplasmic adaptor subunit [Bacteroidales bacterium]